MPNITFEEFCKSYQFTEEELLDSWRKEQEEHEKSYSKLKGQKYKAPRNVSLVAITGRRLYEDSVVGAGVLCSTYYPDAHEAMPAKLEEWKEKGIVERYDEAEEGVVLIGQKSGPWYRIVNQ
ncbi:hypothetical protein GOV06_03095 [Candidatus Woesearchaeota archaeon]|nr:hypothetical protein [Candidatus Woesearchaeota archaeon]